MGNRYYSEKDLENLSRRTKRNVLRLIDNATPEDYVNGLTWYQARHELLQELAEEYNRPIVLIAGAMAVTSPQLRYDKNRKVLVDILNGHWPSEGIHSGIRKAYRILETGDILGNVKGPKVWSFFLNLAYPMCDKSVTIDVWMSKVAGFTQPKELARKGAYEAIAKGIARAAKARGMHPHQAQAIAWIALRGAAV